MLVVVLLFSVITPVSANAAEIQSNLEIINIEYPYLTKTKTTLSNAVW